MSNVATPASDGVAVVVEPPEIQQMTNRISSALVRIQHEHVGRGPGRARTTIRDDVVLVMLEDTLTKGEASLVADGESRTVLGMRDAYQRTMKREMVDAVEAITGRTVSAFMSTNSIGPDLAAEIFVLDPVVP